jgi:deoxycytidylate deaminase
LADRVTDMLGLAARVAMNSSVRYRVGAVVAKGRRVISVGFNKKKTHPDTKKFAYHAWANLHAEMAACIGVDYPGLLGAELYVVRLLKNGSWGVARPCAGCEEFLQQIGIKAVHFSAGLGRKREIL